MSFKCEFKEEPIMPAATIRTRAAAKDLPQVFGKGYAEIAKCLKEQNQNPSGAPFAIYYNMDMEDLDIEFGFPVAKELKEKGSIKAGKTPGGKIATTLHIGPYSEVGPAYDALFKWIEDNGYEYSETVYEYYLNDPQDTPPQELRTQIAIILK